MPANDRPSVSSLKIDFSPVVPDRQPRERRVTEPAVGDDLEDLVASGCPTPTEHPDRAAPLRRRGARSFQLERLDRRPARPACSVRQQPEDLSDAGPGLRSDIDVSAPHDDPSLQVPLLHGYE